MTKTNKPNRAGAAGGAGAGYALPTTVGIVNHDPTRHRAPGYSLAGRLEEKIKKTSPGPQYKLEGGLTPRGTGHSPSYSITGRPRRTVWDSMISKAPGPTTYRPAPQVPSERSAPMYSFGKPYYKRKHSAGPAPNTYQIPTSLGSKVPDLKSGPASSIHGKTATTKGFSHDFAKTPGPAGYNPVDLSHTTKKAPVVTLKGRNKLPPIEAKPGPGPAAYDVKNEKNLSKISPRTIVRAHYGPDMRPPLFAMTGITGR